MNKNSETNSFIETDITDRLEIVVKSLDISQLSSLIKESSFVISNDTGPAHMAAHLSASGITLFGSHTTAHKVSIETKNFKAIQVSDLTKLSPDKVLSKIDEKI